jgi:hypothetical protein
LRSNPFGPRPFHLACYLRPVSRMCLAHPPVQGGNAMNLARRGFLYLLGCGAALPTLSPIARAQAYPSHPVRLIVGFTPGGPTDIFARLIGQWLSERFGQPFVVENRPGAGSTIGIEAVVNAPPDGYTLAVISTSAAVSASFYQHLNFQSDPRHCAGFRHCARALGDGGPSVSSGHDGSGIHCLCESKSRQDRDGVGRQRHYAPHGWGAIQDDGRSRPAPCSISRCCSGPDRFARRAGAGHVRSRGLVGRACPGRQTTGSGGGLSDALARVPGSPNCG